MLMVLLVIENVTNFLYQSVPNIIILKEVIIVYLEKVMMEKNTVLKIAIHVLLVVTVFVMFEKPKVLVRKIVLLSKTGRKFFIHHIQQMMVNSLNDLYKQVYIFLQINDVKS